MADRVDAAHFVARSPGAQCWRDCLVAAAAEHCAQGLPDCSADSPPDARDLWVAERHWVEVRSGLDEELLRVVPLGRAPRSGEADCRAAQALRGAVPLDSDEARCSVQALRPAVRERVRYSQVREHCCEPELPVPLWRAIVLRSGCPTGGQAFLPVVPAWLRTEPVSAVVRSLRKPDARWSHVPERAHAPPLGHRVRSCGLVRQPEPFRLCRFGLRFQEPLPQLVTRVAS